MEDHELLARYASKGDAQAFGELVRRYEPLVRAAARRQVADVHLAQDITQSTLMVLMRKAGRIRRNRPLGPWLLRTTHYLAIDAMRDQSLRKRHESLAATQRRAATTDLTPSPLRTIAPILDQVLQDMSGNDREILVMRYLQEWPIEQIASELRLTPEATRQRLSRAVRRLRKMLARRGVRRDELLAAPVLFIRRILNRIQAKRLLPLAAQPGRRRPALLLKAATGIGLIVVLTGGYVLTRAALHKPRAQQQISPQPLANSRPQSTIP